MLSCCLCTVFLFFFKPRKSVCEISNELLHYKQFIKNKSCIHFFFLLTVELLMCSCSASILFYENVKYDTVVFYVSEVFVLWLMCSHVCISSLIKDCRWRSSETTLLTGDVSYTAIQHCTWTFSLPFVPVSPSPSHHTMWKLRSTLRWNWHSLVRRE
jgi:hypothetical protein